MGVSKDVNKTVSQEHTEEQLKKFFQSRDLNKDGKLDKDELKQAFTYLGSHFAGWRASRAIRAADLNRNGLINDTMEELDKLVEYAHKCGYTIKRAHQ